MENYRGIEAIISKMCLFIQLAFDKTNQFPSRRQIEQKQKGYLVILQDRLSRRRQLRRILSSVCFFDEKL